MIYVETDLTPFESVVERGALTAFNGHGTPLQTIPSQKFKSQDDVGDSDSTLIFRLWWKLSADVSNDFASAPRETHRRMETLSCTTSYRRWVGRTSAVRDRYDEFAPPRMHATCHLHCREFHLYKKMCRIQEAALLAVLEVQAGELGDVEPYW